MRKFDTEVLQFALDNCRNQQFPWLCTIVASVGSSPRPVGAMLAYIPQGRQVGSVSGGCVEEDLLQRITAEEFSTGAPHIIEYGVNAEQNERLGLPCGGRLTLLLQRLSQTDVSWLEPLLSHINNRHCMEREVDITSGTTQLRAVDHFTTLNFDQTTLRQCFGPRLRLLLVGSGQLGESVAELALAMDYEVLVTDPRQQALDQWRGPAVTLLQGMPDDVVRKQAADRYSAIITLTHDPRIDDMALMEALSSEAWYVGALGSRRTTEKRKKRLQQLDISTDDINSLHAPVGLDIGSKTPIEIAVAIMAQLTQLRPRPDVKSADESNP